jgi:O-antigen/teichoic acid export membrane protein
MGLARSITRNAFYIGLSQVTQKLVHVAFVAVAARLLGTHGYGEFLLVTTMVLVTTTFANFGIRPLIVRMMSREKERTEELLSNVLALRIVLAFGAYGILLGFVHLVDYSAEMRVLTAIAGTAILFHAIRDSLEAVLIAHQRMKLLGGIAALAAFIATVMGIAILWLGFGLRWLFVTNVAVEAFFVAVMAGLIWQRIARFRPRFELVVVKTLLIGCLPFLLAFLLGFMDTKVDILMLSLLKGPVDSDLAIGYYGPAHTILMAVMLLPRSLNQVLVPVVSQMIYVEQAVVRDVVEKATKVVILTVSFPVILLTTIFSREIVGILFGPKYGPTADALMILGWAYGFYALNLPSHSILGSTKEMRYFLPVLGGSFLLNVALNFLLIPRYSYLGAAMGSVIVLALGFLCRFYFLHKILDMRLSAARPYARLFLILLLTLAMGYAVRAYLPWVVAAVVMALVYGALLYAFRAVEPEEWRFVVGLVGRKLGNEATREATARREGDGANSRAVAATAPGASRVGTEAPAPAGALDDRCGRG